MKRSLAQQGVKSNFELQNSNVLGKEGYTMIINRQRLKQRLCLNINLWKTYAWKLIGMLFVTAQNWKQLNRPSASEWMNILWCICTMEIYSAAKIPLLKHATTWMSLRTTLLSEISQTQTMTSYMIPYTPNCRKTNLVSESRSAVDGSWGREGSRKLLMVMDMFITLIEVIVSWLYSYIKIHQIGHFKYIDIQVILHQLYLNKTEKGF